MQNSASITTRKIKKNRNTPGYKIWQRGYWDSIIPDKNQLHIVSRYIINNPKFAQKTKNFVCSQKNQ